MIWLCLTLVLLGSTEAASWADCDPVKDSNPGPFGPVHFLNVTWNQTIFYGYIPEAKPGVKFPLVAFMHGSTGQWEMYNENLRLYASHGFVIVFPFIKSPEQDKNPLTTNTDGKYLLKAIDFAFAMNQESSSSLYQQVDESNVVTAGHSMGGTCSIMAASKLLSKLKLAVTQHPGICGPFGPPPWPATWLKSDLKKITAKIPLLFTTATNDGAFWPVPQTAQHEYGCFEGGIAERATAAFVQFSAKACAEDGLRKPFTDEGHNCPMKFADGGRPETPWVLTALKLYTQQAGDDKSICAEMLWGYSEISLRNSTDVDKVDLRYPNATFISHS